MLVPGQEGVFGLCHALGAALWVVLPYSLSVQSPAGDMVLPGAQGSPHCAAWPCSSVFMWAQWGLSLALGWAGCRTARMCGAGESSRAQAMQGGLGADVGRGLWV